MNIKLFALGLGLLTGTAGACTATLVSGTTGTTATGGYTTSGVTSGNVLDGVGGSTGGAGGYGGAGGSTGGAGGYGGAGGSTGGAGGYGGAGGSTGGAGGSCSEPTCASGQTCAASLNGGGEPCVADTGDSYYTTLHNEVCQAGSQCEMECTADLCCWLAVGSSCGSCLDQYYKTDYDACMAY